MDRRRSGNVRSSSSATTNAGAMVNPVKFQVIVQIRNAESIVHGVVLPKIFKNQLKRNCGSIILIDDRNREHPVIVKEHLAGEVKIGNLSWPKFVNNNVVGDIEVKWLWFRLVSEDVFQVNCLNSSDMELFRDEQGQMLMKRCLVKATATSVHKQYLPCKLLEDLNKLSKLKPNWKAKITGPRQDGEVEVIYKFVKENQELQKWRAVGFKGVKWTNFVLENRIEAGFWMMFTNMRNQCFRLDVFNEHGIGVGCLVFSEDQANEWEDLLSDDEGCDDEVSHECRVVAHKHRQWKPCFVIKFKDHSLSSNTLTIPKVFVKEHNLQTYTGAILLYGNLQFLADLRIKKDHRKPNDLNHLVIVYDWGYFLKATGVMVGDQVRFELNEGNSVDGGRIQFKLC